MKTHILYFSLCLLSSILIGQEPTIEVLTDPLYTGEEFQDLAQDSEGNIWIAAQSVMTYDGSSFNLVDDIPCIGFCDATSLATDDEGTVWVGTQDDIFRLSNGNWETMTPFPLNGGDVSDIVIDENGVVWVSVFGIGLFSYDGSNWTTIEETDNGTLLNDINALAVDHDNRLWLGLNNEIILYDGLEWAVTESIPSLGLPSTTWGFLTKEIEIGTDGTIWIAVDDALIYSNGNDDWQKAEFEILGGMEYSPNAIGVDNDGLVWMSVSQFVNVLFQNTAQGEDGFISSPSIQLGYGKEIIVDSDNRIWVGGINDSLLIITKPPVNTDEQTTTDISDISCFPNPALNQITLNFNMPHSSEGFVEIFDSKGIRIDVFKEYFLAGKQQYVLNTSNYSDGLFFAQIRGDFGGHSVKFYLSR